MSIWIRGRVPRAVAVAAIAAIAACAAGGCTTALRSDPGVDPAPATAGPRPDPAAWNSPTTAASPPAVPPGTALADLDDVEPMPLDAPEFGREPPTVSGSGGLSVVAQNQNGIVDTAGWFRSNKLLEPSLDPVEAPPDVPRTYRGAPLAIVLTGLETEFALYGAEFEPTVLVAIRMDTRQVAYALDFGQYTRAPDVAANEEQYVTQAIRWAQQVGNVLYVSTGHRTYSKSSGGMNAYLTAIDVDTRAVLWRSAPLVANANTFEVIGDRIVTGYGFTAEPDWLYVLDRGTGAVTGGIALASGPEFIIRPQARDQLLVRCYDTDYEVALRP